MKAPKQSILTACLLGALAITSFAGIQAPVHAAIGFEPQLPARNLEHPASVTTKHHINIDGKLLMPMEGQAQIIYVNDQPLIALRQVAEALGNKVSWQADTQTAVIEGSISNLLVKPNEATIVRNGKLNVINLNLSEDYMPAAQLKNGVMYVSPKAFELLLNDVAVQGNEIYIAPQRSYIMDSGTSVPVSPDQ